MRLTTDHPDPLTVLAGARYVLDRASYVRIRPENIPQLSEFILDILETTKKSAVKKSKQAYTYEQALQRCFVLDTLNFCFWAERDTPRWRVEWPKGTLVTGGWFALVSCIERALAEGVPILDAHYLQTISFDDVTSIFRPAEGKIPLLPKRMDVLQKAGHILLAECNGSFANLLKQCEYDAIQLVRFLAAHVSSYEDKARYGNRIAWFLKRAQICAHDVSLLAEHYGKPSLAHISQLTAFADYRLPQVYRHCEALEYTPELSSIVDEQMILPPKCFMEIEIRAAAVWITELIRQHIPQYTNAQIDNAVWHVSQLWRYDMKPHHRTYTIFY